MTGLPGPTTGSTAIGRARLLVQGVVQGVGFRPFVYGIAGRLGLSGFVGNDSSGVFIEIEGSPADLDAFQDLLLIETPPLAHIYAVTRLELPVARSSGFTIVASETQANSRTLVSPDLCICADCLRELFDPADRRHLYPFINCTNCGPRFTIIEDVPYDRPRTTMKAFDMCADCAREYRDPGNRRYHAQPIACSRCGPHVWLERNGAIAVDGDSPTVFQAARQALAEGAVVAVKGLGGFHLACDATNDQAVATLRRRKGREGKPFAVMVGNIDAARGIAQIGDDEGRRLRSPERPIVILQKLGHTLAGSVAPGNDSVGVILPYTPLHYLLVGDTPLVMTSGNVVGAPIEIENDGARAHLGSLVDAFLLHDRGIHVPCDDSVVRVFGGADLPLRRSRGYAPFPVQLPFALPPVLAVGGELKSTSCIVAADQAILSQHIGDMENLETIQAFGRITDRLTTLFRVQPEQIACDMHPGYASRRWAASAAHDRGVPLAVVQHHHAHIAAVMAEHGLDGSKRVCGIAFDGTGYGLDGAIWGGEVLVADYAGFRRAAHLRYVPLPGGDGAIKHPYRCALAYLRTAGIPWDDDLPPVAISQPWERQVLARQMESGFNTVPCSSMGRLFDAVASLIGIRHSVSYEAQAAIEMESSMPWPAVEDSHTLDGLLASWQAGRTAYEFRLVEPTLPDEPLTVDPAPLLSAIVDDLRLRVPRAVMAMRFHSAVALLVLAMSMRMRNTEGLDTVALSGGVFQNVRLLSLAVHACRMHGFDVLTHRVVPPNDGGIALGQAVIAGWRALHAH